MARFQQAYFDRDFCIAERLLGFLQSPKDLRRVVHEFRFQIPSGRESSFVPCAALMYS